MCYVYVAQSCIELEVLAQLHIRTKHTHACTHARAHACTHTVPTDHSSYGS